MTREHTDTRLKDDLNFRDVVDNMATLTPEQISVVEAVINRIRFLPPDSSTQFVTGLKALMEAYNILETDLRIIMNALEETGLLVRPE